MRGKRHPDPDPGPNGPETAEQADKEFPEDIPGFQKTKKQR